MTQRKRFLKKPSHLILPLCVALLAAIGPNVFTGYSFNVVNVALIYVLCVYGASIITGMGGQMCFALITFMGIGAYYAANMSMGRLGVTLSTPVILLTVPFVAGAAGLLLGLILFRLQGTFFVLGTMGVVNITYVIFYNSVPLFGGPTGITGVPSPDLWGLKIDSNTKWFYLLLVMTCLGYLVVERIRNTKLGRSLASLRDNDTAALSLGVNVYWTKVLAFTIAAVFCGISGSLYAMQAGFVCGDLFSVTSGTRLMIMLMMGGIDKTIGAVIGAVLVSSLPEIFRNLKDYLNFTYGLALILLMVFQPGGISGMGEAAVRLLHKARAALQSRKGAGTHASNSDD